MSNPNINLSNLDARYSKPADVAAAISTQATTDAGQYASIAAAQPTVVNPSGSDDTTLFTAALNASTTVRLQPGKTYIISSLLTMPANSLLDGAGATIRLTGHSGILASNINTKVKNVRFDFSSDANLQGGEAAVTVGASSVEVSNCSMTGNGYRYGIYIAAGSTLSNIKLINNTITGTSYGILKNLTAINDMLIEGNTITNIARGDGIELNVGADDSIRILNNRVDTVNSGGIANAGIGIGIAGSGPYGDPSSVFTQRVIIAGNQVSNCNFDLIHAEVAMQCQIYGNTVYQTGGNVGTQQGIVLFGCQNCTVENNQVINTSRGINVAMGVVNSNYVGSSTGCIVKNNKISGATVQGIQTFVAGDGNTVKVEGNIVTTSTYGIYHSGGLFASISNNTVSDCTTANFYIDMNPAAASNITVNYSRWLTIENNKSMRAGVPSTLNTFLNCTANSVATERNNNFSVAGVQTDIRDYHVLGDMVFAYSTTTPMICTSPGWSTATATSYSFTANTGDSFLTITSPASTSGSPQFKVGQSITLAGAGASSGALVTSITRFYSTSGTYYIGLTDVIVTTVSSAATIALTTTATYYTVSSANTPDVQSFAASGTWTKPSGKTVTRVILMAGGGGGGSGRLGAAGTVRCGGGGGAGSGIVEFELPTSLLPATVSVVSGIGGTGGAAVTIADTNGNSGSNGGSSSFGAYAFCSPGLGGAGGSATSGAGGTAGGGGTVIGSSGAAASTTGLLGGSANTSQSAGAGGAGGGITSANAASNGGTGGAAASIAPATAAAGVVDTTNPGNGSGRTAGTGQPGAGGGGGAASITTTAQSGGNGGVYGAGGGGGGAGLDGLSSGAGGNGAQGFVLVISE